MSLEKINFSLATGLKTISVIDNSTSKIVGYCFPLGIKQLSLVKGENEDIQIISI